MRNVDLFLLALFAALGFWGAWLGQACKRYKYDLYAPLGRLWLTDSFFLAVARAFNFPNVFCQVPCLILAWGSGIFVVLFVFNPTDLPIPGFVLEAAFRAYLLSFPCVLLLTNVMGVCNRLGLRRDDDPAPAVVPSDHGPVADPAGARPESGPEQSASGQGAR